MDQIQLILANWTFFAGGLLRTLQLAAVTLVFATLIAALVGLASVARTKALRVAALVYVEFFRDIPLLVNVFFVYFAAPVVGIRLDPFTASCVSLSVWGGAYGAEIVRGGFNAVPHHQDLSATALGMKRWEILWFVIIPQMILPILPAFTGLFVLLIQSTSVAAIIGDLELLRSGQIAIERATLMTGQSPAFAVYGCILVLYFIVCWCLTRFAKWLELKLVGRTQRSAAPIRNPAEGSV
ncbi:amino acid ABC transporter permease [Marinivivus vitaminiproducens]|uniref:amino acid ABC transporter permease n=1 Tax=Marinivivus vitaminiproducens TaxID=3035935 RepID=UPI0027A6E334|nr:amino acid ABC transporter permease [Geminicoccaceae bacterium SCSIO 64248]